jgi:hypothetical protein
MSRHGHGRGHHSILEKLGIGALSFGGAAAAIGATYKVAEFAVKCKQLFEVRSENAVFVRLVERVRADLAEAERLMALKSVQEAMRGNKARTLYIQKLMHDIREAIEGMTKYTSRVAGAGWWLGLDKRIWWVLHERGKLLHRQMELTMAREGILEVIGHLESFEESQQGRKDTSGYGREFPEPRREDGGGRGYTSKHVDVDIDIDVKRREEPRERHVVEPDHERREWRRERHVVEVDHERQPVGSGERRRGDEYVEDDFEPERPYRFDNWAQAGFYDGRLDGPLATRPRFWSQQSAGADVSVFLRERQRQQH